MKFLMKQNSYKVFSNYIFNEDVDGKNTKEIVSRSAYEKGSIGEIKVKEIQFDTKKAVEAVPGVLTYFGQEEREFRTIIRGMEDVLDDAGFDGFNFGGLVSEDVFIQNLDFLGERFRENLVDTDVSGEKGVILPPEGTMLTYNYIKQNNLDDAKIFYSSNFTRDESPEEVAEGKTRNFHQIGFEIFNHPEDESSIEAIEITVDMILSTGLKGFDIRVSDKRMINGLISSIPVKDSNIILEVMDKADDNPSKLIELYKENGGTDVSSIKSIVEFLLLGNKENVSLEELQKFAGNSEIFNKGFENISSILENFKEEINEGLFNIKVLPFMAKSWDACPKLLFDARYPGYNGAIAGGGNLHYPGYKANLPKSGAGIGVTRIYDILKKNKQVKDD